VKETNYAYDAISRLSGVTEPDGTITGYTFDANSNISTKNITHPASYEFAFKQNGADMMMSGISMNSLTYAYNANNQLLNESEYVAGAGTNYSGLLEITKDYEYDANGNTLSVTTGGQVDETEIEYAYNALNQLTAYTDANSVTTNYTYYADGMRRSKTTNGTTINFYWDRGYISAESVNGNITAQNYVGVGGIFARQTSENTDYMLKNGHGDVTALLNGGTVTKQYDYNAYGVEKDIDPADQNPFRYCAEYFDKESGQIYLRNRYYSPVSQRFITSDPHWNTQNMIYGDKEYKDGEIRIPYNVPIKADKKFAKEV
jgi:RHS repeat-associated protein